MNQNAICDCAAYNHRPTIHGIPNGHAYDLLLVSIKAAGKEDESWIDGSLEKSKKEANSKKRGVGKARSMASQYDAPNHHDGRNVRTECEFLKSKCMEGCSGNVPKVENAAKPIVLGSVQANIVLKVHQVGIVEQCLVEHLKQDASTRQREQQPVEFVQDVTKLLLTHFLYGYQSSCASMLCFRFRFVRWLHRTKYHDLVGALHGSLFLVLYSELLWRLGRKEHGRGQAPCAGKRAEPRAGKRSSLCVLCQGSEEKASFDWLVKNSWVGCGLRGQQDP